MTRRRTLLILIAVAPLLFLFAVLLYLNFADLSGWKDAVEGLASDAIGRELRIHGEFQPEIGFATHVTATDITLANADWSDDPQMVSVDRLAGEIDLLSILFGPITIKDVEIHGARVLFETDADGRFNWALGDGEPSVEGGDEFEMVIGHALLEDARLIYRPGHGRVHEAELSKLEFTDDGGGMLDLDLAGSFDQSPVEISGRLGTFIGLINANRVEHHLSGRVADAEFSLRGTIGNLGSFSGVEGTASVSGPELSQMTSVFDLDPVIKGPFKVEASAKNARSGSDFTLDASACGMTTHVTGVVDSLTEPSILDATVTASGPDIRTVGAFTGIADLPEEAFAVSGGVRWQGFPIRVRQLEITVGDNSLAADGVLGAPPQMLGTDFTIQGEGPSAASLGALAGIDLPRDRFSIAGRVVRSDGGLEVKDFEARIGQTQVSVHGRVGDPPDYADTSLRFHAAGPDIARFNHLIGLDLPAVDFAIGGRLSEGHEAIILDDVNARVGTTTVRAGGSLRTGAGLRGSAFTIEAQGSDATQIMLLAGFTDLPAEAWKAAGRLAIVDSGYRLDGASADFGSLHVTADGLIAAAPRSVGTHLQLQVKDPDLSDVMSVFGVENLPHQPVRAEGGLRIEDGGYRLDDVAATVGDIEIAIDGLIGGHPDLEGTSADLEIHGPKLESIGPYIRLSGLPTAPYSLTGTVQVTGGRVDLSHVVAEIDGNRVTVNGTVQPTDGLIGTDLQVEVSIPDLGEAGSLAAGFVKLPPLPTEELTVEAGLSIDDAGYEIGDLHATLGDAEATVDGRVGNLPDFLGTDVTIDSDGPNASLFTALTGVTIPVAPFRVRGRLQRTQDAYLFDRVAVQLGTHEVFLHGSLGEAPHLVGTDLELSASGDSTGLIAELTGFRKLPDRPFEISGRFKGTHERFSTHGLEITLGDSDLKGSLEIDIRDRPTVTATVTSNHLDLSHYMKPVHVDAEQEPREEAGRAKKSRGPAISDEPIDFGLLQRADADVEVAIGTLQGPLKVFRNVVLNAGLADGRLEISRFAAAGQAEGRVDGSFLLEPSGERYLLRSRLDARQLRLDLPGSPIERSEQPPIDINVGLEAVGATPHELASSANGAIQLVIGKGVMDSRVLDLVTADILLTLLNAFNPFAKEDAATELQCGVALMSFEDGVGKLEPMAFQSDKMTLLGDGKIDFTTEKLNLEWVTKPRKGVGISASMITNPYIRLGGTLSNPAIELKPLEAVTSTGVAVATLGLSLVAKGMYDRVTAEKKVCKKALEQIDAKTPSGSK